MKSPIPSLGMNNSDHATNPPLERSAAHHGVVLKSNKRGRRSLATPSETHKKMIELSGCLTASEIARRFEVSRQRVHQIFRRWPDLCPKRAIVKAAIPMPTKPKRERREVIICFRLTSRQVGRAKELLGSLGIRKERSPNAACRAVLLIAMNSLSLNSHIANQDELKPPQSERSAANRAGGTL